MKKISLSCFVMWLLIGLTTINTACNNKELNNCLSLNKKTENIVNDTFNVGKFTKLNIAGSVNIAFVQENSYRVVAIGDQSAVENLNVSVDQDTLFIGRKNSNFTSKKDREVKIFITCPNIDAIKLAGNCKFVADSVLTDKMSIMISGTNKIEIKQLKSSSVDVIVKGASKYLGNIIAENINMNITGASKIESAIQANDLFTHCSGAYNAKIDFKGEKSSFESVGAGTLNLNVDCKTVRVKVSGAGRCTISGITDNQIINASGLAKIKSDSLKQR